MRVRAHHVKLPGECHHGRVLFTACNTLDLLVELEAERDIKAPEIVTFQAKLATVVGAPDED